MFRAYFHETTSLDGKLNRFFNNSEGVTHAILVISVSRNVSHVQSYDFLRIGRECHCKGSFLRRPRSPSSAINLLLNAGPSCSIRAIVVALR